MNLKKPQKLSPGDTVAIVSLSSGLAGDQSIIWRTHQGIQRLKTVFDLNVKIMPHALKGSEYVYHHPDKRAEDLMTALVDSEIKGIISCIGGQDSVRLLPYIDWSILAKYPKVFTGYSDTTTSHLMFYKAGVSTSYGPALLTDFAENIRMDDYTVEQIYKTWFNSQDIGRILPSKIFRQFGLRWNESNQMIERESFSNTGYLSLNHKTVVRGHLLGGCVEVLASLRGTVLFPSIQSFEGAILFLETSELPLSPTRLESELRTYGMMGILGVIKGIIVGRPQNDQYIDAYKRIYPKVMKEFNREDMPILYNMNVGHNEPKCILPYGAIAQLDTIHNTFSILESAVTD